MSVVLVDVVCRRVRHVKLLAAQFDIDEAVLTAFPSGITVGIRINKCSEVRSACLSLNDVQILIARRIPAYKRHDKRLHAFPQAGYG